MTRYELEAMLPRLGFNPASYSLWGYREECYSMEHDAEGFAVFYAERGNHSDELRYRDEGDACADLLRRLQEDSTTRCS